MAMLLTLMAQYFVKARWYYQDIDAYSTLQRQTAVTMDRLVRELSAASLKYFYAKNQLTPTEQPSHIIFLSHTTGSSADPLIEFKGATHQVVWKRWVGIYHDLTTKELRLTSFALTPATDNLSSKPWPSVNLSKMKAKNFRPIGHHIEGFSVDSFGSMVSIQVLAQSESRVSFRTDKDKLIEIELSAQVRIGN